MEAQVDAKGAAANAAEAATEEAQDAADKEHAETQNTKSIPAAKKEASADTVGAGSNIPKNTGKISKK
jgi:hypothetical protein